jgi:ParB family chromosome partitioning protein
MRLRTALTGVAEFFYGLSTDFFMSRLHGIIVRMDTLPKEHESQIFNNAVYFIETERIHPNPYQPRRDFDPAALEALADSIRMYGVLQPLVVTRREVEKDDGGIATEYELIAGERRLRASRIAGIAQVPAIIRSSEHSDRMKLELAIIENLQREDLNPVDRAIAFRQLADAFKMTHAEIGKKVGKSREYVSNTLRLLALPQDMLTALSQRKISEGHTRPLLMLSDRPEEQATLFKEIIFRGLNVRDAESVARRIAYEKARKKDRMFDPELVEIEEKMTETLGTRVHIEKRAVGGKVEIDYFSIEDLKKIMEMIETSRGTNADGSPAPRITLGASDAQKIAMDEAAAPNAIPDAPVVEEDVNDGTGIVPQADADTNGPAADIGDVIPDVAMSAGAPVAPVAPQAASEEDLYSIKNFSV